MIGTITKTSITIGKQTVILWIKRKLNLPNFDCCLLGLTWTRSSTVRRPTSSKRHKSGNLGVNSIKIFHKHGQELPLDIYTSISTVRCVFTLNSGANISTSKMQRNAKNSRVHLKYLRGHSNNTWHSWVNKVSQELFLLFKLWL